MSGFSLIEFILVIALFSLVAVFAFPISMSFFNSQVLEENRSVIQTGLRTAHIRALTQRNDRNHGVKLLEDSFVLFEGDSYDTREISEDSVFSMPETLLHTGFVEIVFEKFSGKPSATGTLTLGYASEEVFISVNENGVVE